MDMKIAELLKINGAPISLLDKDTTLTTTMYRIKDIQTSHILESHYVHTRWCVTLTMTKKNGTQVDALYPLPNAAVHYIIQALEPTEASDSWFCWNFFDGILNQKNIFQICV